MRFRYVFVVLLSLTPGFFTYAIGRQSIITYLSWYPSFGTAVGCDKWREGGPDYAKRAIQGLNRPLVARASHASEYSSPITYSLSVNGGLNIKSELTQIKSAGFDVIAYDMLPSPNPMRPRYSGPAYCGLDQFNRFGQIADELSLKVALFSDIKNLSADFPGGYSFNSIDWQGAYSTVVKYYGDKPWYWKPLGRPAIFQFGASVGAMKGLNGVGAIHEWEKVVKSVSESGNALDVFLDVRPADYYALTVAEGDGKVMPFLFAPGAPSVFLNKFLKDLASRTPYPIWSVSPGYYNRKLRVYLPPDFSRIHAAYSNALANNAQAMLVATWNDFEEETDIVESTHKGSALLKVFEYYNAWFKYGKPPPLKYPLMVFALPSYRFENVRSSQPTWGGGEADAKNNEYGQVVYYWAHMKADGWVLINDRKILLHNGLNIGKVDIGRAPNINIFNSLGGAVSSQVKWLENESDKGTDPGMTFVYKMLEGN
ncbi:MAG: hypothetical protein H6Q72_4611 [Firmicutes bacterium]|nr:hypothetical protein [Bacillota bacterium]